MARGNQRDKAREANQKKLADQVSRRTWWPHSKGYFLNPEALLTTFSFAHKKGNSMSGAEMARQKEAVAERMRIKQAAGEFTES